MRFWFLLFLGLSPQPFSYSENAAHFKFSSLVSTGTHIEIFRGHGFHASGPYISYLSNDGTLRFTCLSRGKCVFRAGINQTQLNLNTRNGSAKVTNISNLKIKAQWSAIDATGFDEIVMMAHQAPAIIKPNPAADVKISQQNADVTLLIPDQGWTVEAQANEVFDKSQFRENTDHLNHGHASVQVNAGRLVIPEVLVLNEGHQ